MIRYALICVAGHEFDGWFRDSAGFDAQASEAAIACPVCRSAQVAKAMMAPFVARSGGSAQNESAERQAGEADEKPGVHSDGDGAKLRATMRSLRAAILATTEDVGEQFPAEARRIRDGEAEARPIRGKAELEEAKKLLEEDVPVWLLPDDGH